jgi:hypothetical protein
MGTSPGQRKPPNAYGRRCGWLPVRLVLARGPGAWENAVKDGVGVCTPREWFEAVFFSAAALGFAALFVRTRRVWKAAARSAGRQ